MSERTPGFNASDTGDRLEATFRDGAWSELRWSRAESLSLSPMALGLHYGQSIFEGFKALRQEDGEVAVFRPSDHLARFGRSAARMCMPAPPEAALLQGVRDLVRQRADLVPEAPGFLYLRPLMFSDEPGLAPVPAAEFHLLLAALPVDPLFRKEGVRLTTVPDHARAAPGGAQGPAADAARVGHLRRGARGRPGRTMRLLTRRVVRGAFAVAALARAAPAQRRAGGSGHHDRRSSTRARAIGGSARGRGRERRPGRPRRGRRRGHPDASKGEDTVPAGRKSAGGGSRRRGSAGRVRRPTAPRDAGRLARSQSLSTGRSRRP